MPKLAKKRTDAADKTVRCTGAGLILIPNADKDGITERWKKDRDWGNLPHPWRGIMVAKPSSGKTNLVCNLVLLADPPFERIIIMHVDETTMEYDILDGAEIVTEVPQLTEFEHGVKTLFIVEDIDIKALKPPEHSRLNRIMGYVSTHKGVSVLLTAQQPSQIPPDIRRQANVFFLWRMSDLRAQGEYSQRIGIKPDDMAHIMANIMRNRYDFLTCDQIPGSPAPLRRGLYELIDE